MNIGNIGKKIDILRKLNRMKKKDLAEAAGISATYLSAIIKGNKNPTIETLNQICKALNITLQDFFAYDENNPPIPEHLRELLDSARSLTPEQVNILNEFLKTLK